MRRTKVYPRKWCRNQSDVMANFGAPAEELYLPGVPTAGNPIIGSIAGNVLSPVTTPHWQQALTGLPGDPLGARFDDNTTDSFDAATNAVHDYTTQPLAMLMAVNAVSWTANNYFLGKYLTGGAGAGYLVGISVGGKLAVTHRSAGAVYSLETTAAFPATGLLYAFQWRNASGAGLGSSLEADVTTATVLGSMSVAVPFSLGSVGAYDPAGVTLGPVIIWSGAAAETVIANRATTLPAWWAL